MPNKLKTVTGFVESVTEERFKKSRDRLMKLVDSDLEFIAWICWSLDVMFQELSYEEMFDYIGKVTEEELRERIVPVATKIDSESAFGVVLDNNFELLKKLVIYGFLGLENQLGMYPKAEIEARGIEYIASILFWEGENVIDKKHYRLLVPPALLWIFPEPPEKWKNHVVSYPILLPDKKLTRNYNVGGSLKPEVAEPKFQIPANIYQVYLGDPKKVWDRLLTDTSKAGKLGYLVLLMDLVSGFEADKETRLEMLGDIYNLKSEKTKEEVEIMNEFAEWSTQRYNQGKEAGIPIGKEEERSQNIKNIVKNLINQSKQKGEILSEKEALKQAEALIS